MAKTTAARDWTVGQIAKEAGCALHRIEYLIRSRRILPIRLVGAYRVFSSKTARQLIETVAAADAAKKNRTA